MFTLCGRLAGIVVLGAAFLFPAFAAGPIDPFPDQPGALSAAEIQDTTEAMKSMLGTEPALPLVASGKRRPEHMLPGYALFATSFTDYSAQVRTRRQVICNFFRPMGKWQCTKPHTEFRMTARGIKHVFTYVVDQGPEDSRIAVDVAGFMYSPCFVVQFKALGGANGAPTFNAFPITTVVSDSGGYTVRTGPDDGGDVYRLTKTNRSADGCGFNIVSVRMGKTGLALPESYAKELAAQWAKVVVPQPAEVGATETGTKLPESYELTERAAKERAERDAKERAEHDAKELAQQQASVRTFPEVMASTEAMRRRNRAEMMMGGAMLSGLAALVAPWLVLLVNRWGAAAAAGVLAVAGTTLFLTTEQDMVGGNIRIDLIIIPALMLVAWIETVGLGVWAFRRGQVQAVHAPRVSSRIPLVILGIAGSVLLALILIFTIPEILILLFSLARMKWWAP